MTKLEKYHEVWLEAHPYRSEQWLRERLADGFDVHHLDGDHGNNTWDNLVLIDHGDHMWLHLMGRKLYRLRPNRANAKRWKTAEPVAAKARKSKPSVYQEPGGIWVICANGWQVFVRHTDTAEEALTRIAELDSAKLA